MKLSQVDKLRKIIKEEIENISRNIPDSESEAPVGDENVDVPETDSTENQDDVKSQLLFIAERAQKCSELINDGTELEPWVESHISAAKELIGHAADFLGYDEASEQDDINDDNEDMDDNATPSEPGDDSVSSPKDEKLKIAEDVDDFGQEEIQGMKRDLPRLKSLSVKNPKNNRLRGKVKDYETLTKLGEQHNVTISVDQANQLREYARQAVSSGNVKKLNELVDKLRSYSK